MADLKSIHTDINWVEVTITRLGAGQDTRYQIQAQLPQPALEPVQDRNAKYYRGEYGHLVNR
jgi:hypothetical protein